MYCILKKGVSLWSKTTSVKQNYRGVRIGQLMFIIHKVD